MTKLPENYAQRNPDFAPNLSYDGERFVMSLPILIEGDKGFNMRIELEPHEVAFLVSQGAKCLAAKLAKY